MVRHTVTSTTAANSASNSAITAANSTSNLAIPANLRDELTSIINNKFIELEAKYRDEIESLKEEIKKLKASNLVSTNSTQAPWSKILFDSNRKQPEAVVNIISAAKIELKENEKRSKNVIIFGLAKSAETDDLNLVKDLINNIDSRTDIKSFFRFKQPGDTNKIPPILVECKSEIDRFNLLKSARNLDKSGKYKNVYLNPDMTLLEREYSSKLAKDRKELNDKRSDSEKKSFYWGVRNNVNVKVPIKTISN